MDQTLTLILDEIKKLNGKFDNLEGKLNNLDYRFDRLVNKAVSLETNIDKLDTKANPLGGKLDRLEESLERFEAKHKKNMLKIIEAIERKY